MPEDESRGKPLLLHVIVSPALLKRIEDYQFDHRLRTRADAVRTLMEHGLNAEGCPQMMDVNAPCTCPASREPKP